MQAEGESWARLWRSEGGWGEAAAITRYMWVELCSGLSVHKIMWNVDPSFWKWRYTLAGSFRMQGA